MERVGGLAIGMLIGLVIAGLYIGAVTDVRKKCFNVTSESKERWITTRIGCYAVNNFGLHKGRRLEKLKK